MSFSLKQWRNMPPGVLLGIGIWAASWALFLVFIYLLIEDVNWVLKFAISVVLLAVFLLRGNNWARMIALMANAMAFCFLAFLAYFFLTQEKTNQLIICGANMILFAMASYFFLINPTAHFFKSQAHTPSASDEQGGPRGS